MSIRKLYIRALLILAFVGPGFWLVFTDDGKRFADVMVLKVMGRPDIGISFADFTTAVAEADLAAGWPDADFECNDQATPFGSRVCVASIAAFNGTPARYITFFFADGNLNAAKIGYQGIYHDDVVDQLRSMLGEPVGDDAGEQKVLRWTAGPGIVVLPQERVGMEQEPALLWLATGGIQ